MNRSFTASWLVTILLSMPGAAAPTILIRVDNRAHVPGSTLHTALLEAERLFKPIAMRITWESHIEPSKDLGIDMSSPAAQGSDPRSYLVLSITTGTPHLIYPGALGFALPFAHSGAHASIFYDRVKAVAMNENTAPDIVLGHAIAHELGHVLLRSEDHSAAGLMQARWNRATWQLASKGLLGFLSEQREPMRKNALAVGASDR